MGLTLGVWYIVGNTIYKDGMISGTSILKVWYTVGCTILYQPIPWYMRMGWTASGSNAPPSSTSRTSASSSEDASSDSAPRSRTAMPMPMAAECRPAGTWPSSLRATPRVSFWSAIGTTMRSGEAERVAAALALGTAVYTRSAPLRSAASDARIGAPWYTLLPPTTSTRPFCPLCEPAGRPGTNPRTTDGSTLTTSAGGACRSCPPASASPPPSSPLPPCTRGG